MPPHGNASRHGPWRRAPSDLEAAQQLLLVVETTRRHGLRKLAAISMHFAAEFILCLVTSSSKPPRSYCYTLNARCDRAVGQSKPSCTIRFPFSTVKVRRNECVAFVLRASQAMDWHWWIRATTTYPSYRYLHALVNIALVLTEITANH